MNMWLIPPDILGFSQQRHGSYTLAVFKRSTSWIARPLFLAWNIGWLVVWLPFLAFSHSDVGISHHPLIDEVIFFRGGEKPPTSWAFDAFPFSASPRIFRSRGVCTCGYIGKVYSGYVIGGQSKKHFKASFCQWKHLYTYLAIYNMYIYIYVYMYICIYRYVILYIYVIY